MCVCVCVCAYFCVWCFINRKALCDIFSVFNFKNAVGTVPINQRCLFVSKKRTMHKSVIICLNNFIKAIFSVFCVRYHLRFVDIT